MLWVKKEFWVNVSIDSRSTSVTYEVYNSSCILCFAVCTHPDGERERDRDMDRLLDPELRERLLLRETLRDLPPMLPASLAPTISLVMYILHWSILAPVDGITFWIRHIGIIHTCWILRLETQRTYKSITN